MKKTIVSILLLVPLLTHAEPARQNPLLAPWAGPYGGVPPFDKVKVEDFKPALEQAMAEQRKEIEAIAKDEASPTFENTLVALEDSGMFLDRVNALFGLWGSNLSTPEYRAVEQEMAPKLAALQDEIIQNTALFKRIDTIYNSPEQSRLTPEQKRLVWFQDTRFILNGARLGDERKTRVASINQRLAALATQFRQNEMGDEEDGALVIDKPGDLAGLPRSVVDSASAEASRRKEPGKWVIANIRSAMEPFLTYADSRELRERAFRIWTSRGDNGNAHDNNKIVTETLKLRAERSKLLGYPTYAGWRLADTMAKDPKVAMDLMLKVWKPAVVKVHHDVARMQAMVDAEKKNFKIQPWDYRYYAEKVRKAAYDLDLDALKPFLQLENIRKAMFWSAGRLFGFKFVPVRDVPVYEPTVTVYKVLDATNRFVGLWYFDPYSRPGKDSGAWMNNYREQFRSRGQDITPIVSNNANFIAGTAAGPVTISWDDAVTMFHEFGHALHGLNSNVTYKTLSGTNTTRDFVEFPSQLNENYLRTPGVLKFLVDGKGRQIPKALLSKIDRAKTFNAGFDTVELLASGIVDMKLHLVANQDVDPKEFEKSALKELGMPDEIVMRHRIPQFGHIFSSEGYAAGYYGYLWAQVLATDAYEAFTETGNPYDRKMAKKYHDYIVSVGNTQDPAENYRKFRGRDPKVDALLRARGFPLQE